MPLPFVGNGGECNSSGNDSPDNYNDVGLAQDVHMAQWINVLHSNGIPAPDQSRLYTRRNFV